MKRLIAVTIWLLFASAAQAQDTVPVRDRAAAQDSIEQFPPGKALMRSLLVPGWGQFSVGAWKRGTFFLLAQGSSYYMLVRTNSRLDRAQDRLAVRRGLARDSIIANADSLPRDTLNLQLRIDSVGAVISSNSLVQSRERHMQDWITYTLFFTLASGVDAFVAAHLADFPGDITTERRPGGATEVRISVPLPLRRQK
jgi:hypothetical protein